MIDSHAHLDSARYDEDRDALLARALDAGVRTILSIGIGEGPDTMHQALDLARAYATAPAFPKSTPPPVSIPTKPASPTRRLCQTRPATQPG